MPGLHKIPYEVVIDQASLQALENIQNVMNDLVAKAEQFSTAFGTGDEGAVNNAEKQVKELTEKIKELRAQLKEAQASPAIIDPTKEKESLTTLEALETKVKELKKHRASLDIVKDESKIRQVSADINHMEGKIKELKSTSSKYDTQQAKLNKTLKQEQGIIGKLEKELKELQARRKQATNIADVRKINKEIERTRAQLTKVKQTTQTWGKALGSFQFKFNALGNIAADVAMRMRMAITAAVKDIYNTIKDFEKGFANVLTLLSEADKKQYGTFLKRTQIELMQQYGFAIQDANKALFDAISAGVKAKDANEFMAASARLATGGVTDMKSAVQGIVSTMNAYHLSVKDAAEIAEAFYTGQKFGVTTVKELVDNVGRVAPIAYNANMSYKDMLATLAQLTRVGLNTEESVTALRNVLNLLVDPADNARKALEKYNIPVDLTGMNANKLIDILGKLNKAYEENPDAIAKMFPNIRALIGIFALLGESTKGLQEITDEVNDRFITYANLSGAVAKQLETVQTRANRVNAAWKTFILSMDSGENALSGTVKGVQNLTIEFLNMLSGVESASEKAYKQFDEVGQIVRNQERQMPGLIREYNELKDKAIDNEEAQEKLHDIMRKIVDVVPEAAAEFGAYGEVIGISEEKINLAIEGNRKLWAMLKEAGTEKAQKEIEDLAESFLYLKFLTLEGQKDVHNFMVGREAAGLMRSMNDEAMRTEKLSSEEIIKNKDNLNDLYSQIAENIKIVKDYGYSWKEIKDIVDEALSSIPEEKRMELQIDVVLNELKRAELVDKSIDDFEDRFNDEVKNIKTPKLKLEVFEKTYKEEISYLDTMIEATKDEKQKYYKAEKETLEKYHDTKVFELKKQIKVEDEVDKEAATKELARQKKLLKDKYDLAKAEAELIENEVDQRKALIKVEYDYKHGLAELEITNSDLKYKTQLALYKKYHKELMDIDKDFVKNLEDLYEDIDVFSAFGFEEEIKKNQEKFNKLRREMQEFGGQFTGEDILIDMSYHVKDNIEDSEKLRQFQSENDALKKEHEAFIEDMKAWGYSEEQIVEASVSFEYDLYQRTLNFLEEFNNEEIKILKERLEVRLPMFEGDDEISAVQEFYNKLQALEKAEEAERNEILFNQELKAIEIKRKGLDAQFEVQKRQWEAQGESQRYITEETLKYQQKSNLELLGFYQDALKNYEILPEETVQEIKGKIEEIKQELALLGVDLQINKKPTDVWELLGIDLSDNAKNQFQTFFTTAKDALDDYTQSFVDAADRRLDAIQEEIDLSNTKIDQLQRDAELEYERMKDGYAHNYDLKQQELADEKERQKELLRMEERAQQEREKAARRQIIIDEIVTQSKLLVAMAQIFANETKNAGWVGVLTAAAGIASMIAMFANLKSQSADVVKVEAEQGMTRKVVGKRHTAGGEPFDVEVEGGERYSIFNRTATNKYDKEIVDFTNAANNDRIPEYIDGLLLTMGYDVEKPFVPKWDNSSKVNDIIKESVINKETLFNEFTPLKFNPVTTKAMETARELSEVTNSVENNTVINDEYSRKAFELQKKHFERIEKEPQVIISDGWMIIRNGNKIDKVRLND